MAKVAVIVGSHSDWKTMRHASATLDALGVPHDRAVVSAHRTPEWMFSFATSAEAAGVQCIIAGAGGAAHLPGMVASLTNLPVLGVPMPSRILAGIDSLLSIVQMPAGVPTATFAIGDAGAINAALFAVRLLALNDARLAKRLLGYRQRQAKLSIASSKKLLAHKRRR